MVFVNKSLSRIYQNYRINTKSCSKSRYKCKLMFFLKKINFFSKFYEISDQKNKNKLMTENFFVVLSLTSNVCLVGG